MIQIITYKVYKPFPYDSSRIILTGGVIYVVLIDLIPIFNASE